MSTATSITQFMAILSGGTNPGLLKQNQGEQSNNIVNFESLLNQTATEGDPTVDAVLANLTLADGSSTSQLPLSDNAELLTPLTTGDTDPSASIWQFIQQQANNIDSGNQLVLNLSEKGIPDSVIQELKSVFGEHDLITIIRDPQLNAQLDNALQAIQDNLQIVDGEIIDAGQATLQTDNLIAVVGIILDQSRTDSVNTLSFTVDDEATLDTVLENLVDGGIPEQAYLPVQIVETQQKPVQPIEFAISQAKIGGNDLPLQTANPVSNSVNPFTVKGEPGKPELTGLPNAEARLTQNGAPALDRIAALNNANTNQNAAQSNAQPLQSFTDALISADGDSLLVDGKFAVAFEAAFKTASQSANPIINQPQATQSHPATQAAALSLTKMATKSASGETNQRYTLRLDPPEMGRVDIKMDIAENTNKMKVVITAEKTESLSLLQRDMHTLLKAMQDAGFENISSSDLTFNLSQQGEDMAGGRDGQNHGHSSSQSGDVIDGDMDIIETQMSIIIDPVTGQQSVNMLV